MFAAAEVAMIQHEDVARTNPRTEKDAATFIAETVSGIIPRLSEHVVDAFLVRQRVAFGNSGLVVVEVVVIVSGRVDGDP